jgi:16S rRNA (cytosine967-C5)-methyltransferase
MIALNQQADTVLRTNALKASRDKVKAALKEEDIKTKPTKISPFGLKVEGKANLFNSKAFKSGLFEVQDEGSQILAILAETKPKQKILDMCCGAGGKLLAMAATMNHTGSLIGTDVNERRLMETKKRLKRAGISNAMLKVISSENDKYLKRQANRFDTIFVDAPCSGTGTWRRNPDSKWNLDAAFVANLTNVQASILKSAAKLVKPGGTVAYATCSILRKENHDQVEKFLAEHENFELVDINTKLSGLTEDSVLQLTPAQHNCDGFFVALLKRKN